MDISALKLHSLNAYRSYKRDDSKYKESMKKFYMEGESNPSVSKIVLDNTVTKSVDALKGTGMRAIDGIKEPVILPLYDHFGQMAEFEARANLALLSMQKAIDVMDMPQDKSLDKMAEKQEFDKKFNELYPRTAKMRERIIESHRLDMDKVTPKAKWSEKVMYAKTNGELKELYPKSLRARTELFINGQIKNNEVTKRVSGFFNRLSYLPSVIKGIKFASKTVK